VAKAHGPEEFFEVFRTVSQKGKRTQPEAKEEPAPGPKEPVPSEESPPQAAAAAAPAAPAAPAPRPAQRPAEGRFPFSVFTEDEPKIAIRRSTLIFALIVIIVLLFIFYALGKRAGRSATAGARTTTAIDRDGFHETRLPAQPDALRNKCVVVMKMLRHTQAANEMNAREYRDFLNTSSETAFIKAGGKQAFIVSYQQWLYVCVGPFERLDSPDLDAMLPNLRRLRYNSIQQFANAGVEPLPYLAKLFEHKGAFR